VATAFFEMTSSARTPALRSPNAFSRRTSLKKERRAPVTFQHNVFFAILALVLCGSFFALNIRPDAFTVYLPTTISFVAVGVVSFAGIYDAARDRAFSLNTSHWTYILFFLFYAPFVQFLVQDSAFQSDLGLFDRYAIWINCITLTWCGLYYFFYGSSALPDASSTRPANATHPEGELFCSAWTYFFVVVLCAVSLAALVHFMGVEVLLFRSAGTQLTGEGGDRSAILIINALCRAVPVVATGMLMITRGKSKWAHWGTFVFSSLCALVLNNPVAIARFWFGAIAIGFCCLYIQSRNIRLSGLWIAGSLTLAGLTVFPLLSATRNVSSAEGFSSVEVKDWSSNLTDADFDGYSMIIATVEWTRREGTTNGYQLIGNTLFWVPRMFWYDKPYGSGQKVAEYFDMVNVNMAEPMTAEAYVNFGLLGIPIYALAIARLFSVVDHRYWRGQKQGISVLNISYPFLTALTIYFMRGDYLSGMSSTLSLLGSAALVIWIFRASSRRVPVSS
jgi:hypothetical protein